MLHNSLHTQANREKVIATQQTSGEPLPVRTLLGIEIESALSLYRSGKRYGVPDMVQRGRKQFRTAREQLTLLDAIEYGYIKPVPVISDAVMRLLEGEK